MIVDGFYHLDGSRELGVGVQGHQGSSLIPDIGPLTWLRGGVVEGVLQIAVPLAPHQTQILLLALIGSQWVLIAVLI